MATYHPGLIAIGSIADTATIHRHSECGNQPPHALQPAHSRSHIYSVRYTAPPPRPTASCTSLKTNPPPLISSPTHVERRRPGPSPALSLPLVSQGRKRSARARGRKLKADLDRSICQGAISGTGFFPAHVYAVCILCMCIAQRSDIMV